MCVRLCGGCWFRMESDGFCAHVFSERAGMCVGADDVGCMWWSDVGELGLTPSRDLMFPL